MRLGTFAPNGSGLDELWHRVLGMEPVSTWSGGSSVRTDVLHTPSGMVIRVDLPGVDPDQVDVAVHENVLVITGKRDFPYEGEDVRFVARGTFYGQFTQKVALGRGLDVDKIGARFDNGVLELTIPYAEGVKPKKIPIEVGKASKELNE